MPNRRTVFTALAAALALPLLSVAALAQDRSGTFTGASDHVTTGTGAIVMQDGRAVVSLGEDFSFDGAPDPKVALGRDGFDANTILGPLRANNGAQTYALPEGLDPAAYNEVWIWCERFNVPLGVARLN